MILVFTSTAFNDWIQKHIEVTSGTAFNPYLTLLFWAMYVVYVFQEELSVSDHSLIGPACLLVGSWVHSFT